MRAYIINRQIDDIRGTVYRQTMFAAFEQITHGLEEAGENTRRHGVRPALDIVRQSRAGGHRCVVGIGGATPALQSARASRVARDGPVLAQRELRARPPVLAIAAQHRIHCRDDLSGGPVRWRRCARSPRSAKRSGRRVRRLSAARRRARGNSGVRAPHEWADHGSLTRWRSVCDRPVLHRRWRRTGCVHRRGGERRARWHRGELRRPARAARRPARRVRTGVRRNAAARGRRHRLSHAHVVDQRRRDERSGSQGDHSVGRRRMGGVQSARRRMRVHGKPARQRAGVRRRAPAAVRPPRSWASEALARLDGRSRAVGCRLWHGHECVRPTERVDVRDQRFEPRAIRRHMRPLAPLVVGLDWRF